jgi:hypothetical protein
VAAAAAAALLLPRLRQAPQAAATHQFESAATATREPHSAAEFVH